jgi:hydroxymethylpyrimidine kinase/phosphomethylpyrimidine kinase
LTNVVIDPVIRSTSGFDLIDDEAMKFLVDRLLPLGDVITPNMAEAERLTGHEVKDLAGMEQAARKIREICAAGKARPGAKHAVLVKGGHLSGEATDLLDDGQTAQLFRAQRIETRNTHGTGCTLSSAIAALLAQGREIPETINLAKQYLLLALQTAPDLGHGAGPLNHGLGIWD